MRLGDVRVVKEIVREAVKVGSRVSSRGRGGGGGGGGGGGEYSRVSKWVRDLMISLEKFR